MRRFPLACVVSLALACTTREADAPSEVAEAPLPEPKPAPEPAPTPIEAQAPIAIETPPPDPIPGFILYTQARSILIPIDGSARVVGEGLWVQDDSDELAPVTHTLVIDRARADVLKLPVCACTFFAGACTDGSLEGRTFDPRTGSIVASPGPRCTCVHLPTSLGFAAAEVRGQHYEACAGLEDEGIASLVAGRLDYQGWWWTGACFGGDSIYDATSTSYPLIADPPDTTDIGMRPLGCVTGLMPEVVPPWPFDERELVDCDGYNEARVYLLRRGDLWEVGYDISGAGGWRSFAKRPVRPDSCPSINDPCGDPAPFRTPAKLDRREREFWIATDGRVAITGEHEAYALWRADNEAPIEFELAGVDASTDVIGVRVHADLGRLRALIEQHPGIGVDRAERAPRTFEPEACFELGEGECRAGVSAREWGDDCITLIGIEQWDFAEASCLCGLAVADTPASRAALLYNLGLIAETQGAHEQAVAHYRASLELRPDNRAVQRRLAKLR